jgi:hypothetical protein
MTSGLCAVAVTLCRIRRGRHAFVIAASGPNALRGTFLFALKRKVVPGARIELATKGL